MAAYDCMLSDAVGMIYMLHVFPDDVAKFVKFVVTFNIPT